MYLYLFYSCFNLFKLGFQWMGLFLHFFSFGVGVRQLFRIKKEVHKNIFPSSNWVEWVAPLHTNYALYLVFWLLKAWSTLDIYNSLFLIQVKHDLWNYLFLHLLEKWRVNRVPCLVWHYCASHHVCCDCEICSISEIIKTCTVFKSTFTKYLILTTVKKRSHFVHVS